MPEDRNLKEALAASALPQRTGSCDETPMSYVIRKELHFLGTLFIGARLPCPSSREFASGPVHVDIAEGGREVLELLAGRSYDVILSNLNMPGMSGEEIYRRREVGGLMAYSANLVQLRRRAAIYVDKVPKRAKLREQRLSDHALCPGSVGGRVGIWMERYNRKG